MTRYLVPGSLALRHWEHESAAVARLHRAGTTHLIGAEALAVIQAAVGHAQGLELREIAYALGVEGEADCEVDASLQRIVDGLLQSGLLRRVDDDDHPRLEGSR